MKHYDLALKWAPIDYQYIRLGNNPEEFQTKKDLLCPVNFDSKTNPDCWNTGKVKERLDKVPLADMVPVCYYAVSETKTHYFIIYSFYHADDDTHINDMEGCLVILEKDETDEVLLGMVTVAHLDFWKYSYRNNLLKKSGERFSRDELLETDEEVQGAHPLIQQEDGKHGLYALGTKINIGTKIVRWFFGLLNIPPDVIVYYPGSKAIQYSSERLRKGKGTPYNPSFYYELVDIFDEGNGLWERWQTRPNETFVSDGKFHGNKANPPWLWKPGLEHETPTPEFGKMWKDPVSLAKELFSVGAGRKEFSSEYVLQLPEK